MIRNNENPNIIPLNGEEKRERAEEFLLRHSPDTLKNFTLYKTIKLTHIDRFYYGQMVMALPLRNAGCFMDIDSTGDIVDIIGISEGMEVIREVDLGEEMGIVWRDRDWKMEKKILFMDSFFKSHSEETVKAFVSKKTGKIRSFIWYIDAKTGEVISSKDYY